MSSDLKAKVQGQVAKVGQAPPQTVKEYIAAMQPQIEKALPKMISAERFTRIALTAVSSTPQLAACEPKSFIGALMTSAQLGLEPNTPLGQAYLIPFRNNGKNVTECTFQLGYKGLIELAHRSGEMQSIEARCVYENDEFEFEYGLEGKLVHKPAMSARGELIAVYATYHLVNGGYGFEVMSVEDVKAHAKKFSKAYSRGPWVDNFEEMAKKTVLKKLLKYAPLKIEVVQALSHEDTVKRDIDEDMTTIPVEYVDTQPTVEVEVFIPDGEAQA